MLDKTTGIVLSITAYNDKTSLVHVYTEKYGRISYALPLQQGKKSRLMRTLFSPFAILYIDGEVKPRQDIQRIKDVQTAVPVFQLHYDPIKNAITLFLAEFLSKVIREPEPNNSFFRFLLQSIQFLNLMEDGKANFHICFLIELTGYMGFYPNISGYKKGDFFDLINGVFSAIRPNHSYFLSSMEAGVFYKIMRMNYNNLNLFHFNRVERYEILDYIITYFKLHHAGFQELKSLDVLKALFD